MTVWLDLILDRARPIGLLGPWEDHRCHLIGHPSRKKPSLGSGSLPFLPLVIAEISMAPASRPPTATPPAASSSRIDSPSLKAALAMALMHYKRLPSRAAAAAAGTSTPPPIHWKRKVSSIPLTSNP